VAPHQRAVPLTPGEPTLLEIEIWPTSITLAPGERLRLELVVDDADLGTMQHSAADRRSAAGATVHFGGTNASYLLVPVIAPGAD
jgi:predicted acyl esterase